MGHGLELNIKIWDPFFPYTMVKLYILDPVIWKKIPDEENYITSPNSSVITEIQSLEDFPPSSVFQGPMAYVSAKNPNKVVDMVLDKASKPSELFNPSNKGKRIPNYYREP